MEAIKMKLNSRIATALLLMGLAISGVNIKAQDVSYSQTYEAPLYLSPAFTGLTNGLRVGLNYRNQWPGVGSVFQNYAITVDNFFEQFSSGLGLMWQCDNQGKGLIVGNNVSLLYAYEFSINKSINVRPGISFRLGQRKIDRGKMVTFTDITADGKFVGGGSSVDIERTKNNHIDAGAGVMIYNDDFWGGIAFDHMMQPDVSFTDAKDILKLKLTAYAGYRWTYEPSYRGSEPKTVTLALNYKHQYSFNQIEIGAFWYYSPIELGVSYRGLFFNVSGELNNRDALIPSLGINISAFRLGYSYDMTISDLSSFGNGAHEISLIYRIIPSNVKKRSYKMKPVPCSEPIMGYSYSGHGKKSHGHNQKRKGVKRN